MKRGMCCLALLAPHLVWPAALGESIPWQDHELPHVMREHAAVIAEKRHEYTIRMGGTVDMDHAMTREYARWRIGWQPNESLTIENVGSVVCENARIVMNGRGNWYALDDLLHEALGSARSDQEKVYLVWEFCRSNRHHDDPLFEGSRHAHELHDPVKMLMTYGAGLCDDSGSIGASMFHAAGFGDPEPFVRALHGHVMCEVFASGRWQFMDIDENVFYLDRENELPVSGDAVARDHDLAHREVHYGPVFGNWLTSVRAGALFGRDDGRSRRLSRGYEVRVNLRPGERIEYRWDNVGKWAMRLPHRGRRWVGNSRLTYEPPLDGEKAGAVVAEDTVSLKVDGAPAVAGRSRTAHLTYAMASPFVFCGGEVTASFRLRDADDAARIEVWSEREEGPGTPVAVWQAAGPGAPKARVVIDKAIDPIHGNPKYRFWIRVKLAAASGEGGATLTDLGIRGDIMVSPIALPRLRLGENRVVYTDDSRPGRNVRVTYRWRETTATNPLPAPAATYPPDGATVRDPRVTYRWKPVPGASAYHLRVSRDPAMRWPYRPGLDTVYRGTDYTVPFWGIYAPDTAYYWRIRTQNDKGIWGPWSAVQTFSWAGPRVPVNVRMVEAEGRYTLQWDPNPRGSRPVAYEVYGSDIKGFSVAKEPHEIPTLGTMPANYVGRTKHTRMAVAGSAVADRAPDGVEHPRNLNRCYYRVVALDAHETPSGCSDYVELPHPFIWTAPVRTARIGRPYRYQPMCIRDRGDLQCRYVEPRYTFWEEEHLRFSRAAGPRWLAVDPATGLVTGTPPRGSAGTYRIRLRVTASFEKRTGKDRFTKDLPDRTSEQKYSLEVRD